MFGKMMTIQGKAGLIQLRPFAKEEIACERVCKMFTDHEVTRWTLMGTSPTVQDEADFFEKMRADKDGRTWGVYLNDSQLIGITSIDIHFPNHMGSTGFMLFDKSFWRKGIASTAHIARTYYAVTQLDFKTITSGVLSPNIGSLKALQSVGYFITGYTLAERYRDGIYHHHVNVQWIRPGYEDLIFVNGMPEELKERVQTAMERAKITLERASNEVKMF